MERERETIKSGFYQLLIFHFLGKEVFEFIQQGG